MIVAQNRQPNGGHPDEEPETPLSDEWFVSVGLDSVAPWQRDQLRTDLLSRLHEAIGSELLDHIGEQQLELLESMCDEDEDQIDLDSIRRSLDVSLPQYSDLVRRRLRQLTEDVAQAAPWILGMCPYRINVNLEVIRDLVSGNGT